MSDLSYLRRVTTNSNSHLLAESHAYPCFHLYCRLTISGSSHIPTQDQAKISACQSGAHAQTTGPALSPWQAVAPLGIVAQVDRKRHAAPVAAAAAAAAAAAVSLDPDPEPDAVKSEAKPVDDDESKKSVVLLFLLVQYFLRGYGHDHDLDESRPSVYPHQTNLTDPKRRCC